MKSKSTVLKKLLKLSVIIICTVGFLLQTFEFLFLYWTYPTVVDIQVTVPSEIDMPGITICNSNGIRPSVICTLKSVCTQPSMLRFLDICKFFPDICENGQSSVKDFTGIGYQRFLKAYSVNASFMHRLRIPLSQYLKCSITSGSQERPCDLDDVVLGSYYSEYFMPNFCYTINSLWSNPNKKISKIQKSDRINMEFYIDISDRLPDPPLDLVQKPKYNYPSNPMVQIGVHSPYLTVSPYIYGQPFTAGKKYEIRLKQDEKHLLPAPYQTNCTDYMPEWRERNGVAPLDQLMAIQECKLNASLKAFGCVPITVDFPHNETICQTCKENCDNITNSWAHCTDILQRYNQPCDFTTYNMQVEEKLVYIEMKFESYLMREAEGIVLQRLGYNCSEGTKNDLTRRCQTVQVEIGFDNFEITNLTYNPKFESLELFSVIGGYMGMYLGVSIVAVYDFGEFIFGAIYESMKKKKAVKKHKMKSKSFKSYNKIKAKSPDGFRRRANQMHSFTEYF